MHKNNGIKNDTYYRNPSSIVKSKSQIKNVVDMIIIIWPLINELVPRRS